MDKVLSFFTNAGFSISSICICLIVLFAYFLKTREKKLEYQSKFFVVYLISIIVMSLAEVAYVLYFLKHGMNGRYAEVMYDIYSVAILFATLSAWMFVISYRSNVLLDKKTNKSFKVAFYSIVGVIEIVICVLAFLLPVRIYQNYGIYNFDSISITTTLVYVLISTTGFIFLLYFKNKNITKNDLAPIVTSVVILCLLLVYRMIKHIDINIETFQLTIFALGIFFTVENQDYKLLDTARQKQTAAQNATNSQKDFLANLSHDFRSPMNTILGLSQLMLKEPTITSESAHDDMENIHEASTSLISLINNITDFSYSVSDKGEVKKENYDIYDAVFEINDSVVKEATDKGIEFSFSISDNVPRKLQGDSKMIVKTLEGIIGNIVSHSNTGQITLEVKGEKKDKEVYQLEFIVKATGTGMKPEKFKFDEESDIGSDYSKALNSDVLGLIVAKNLIEKLGAKIGFSEEVGYDLIIDQEIGNSTNSEPVDKVIEEKPAVAELEKELVKEKNEEVSEEKEEPKSEEPVEEKKEESPEVKEEPKSEEPVEEKKEEVSEEKEEPKSEESTEEKKEEVSEVKEKPKSEETTEEKKEETSEVKEEPKSEEPVEEKKEESSEEKEEPKSEEPAEEKKEEASEEKEESKSEESIEEKKEEASEVKEESKSEESTEEKKEEVSEVKEEPKSEEPAEEKKLETTSEEGGVSNA